MANNLTKETLSIANANNVNVDSKLKEFTDNFLSKIKIYSNINSDTLVVTNNTQNFVKEELKYNLYKYAKHIYNAREASFNRSNKKYQEPDENKELELSVKHQLDYIFNNLQSTEFNFSEDMINFLAKIQFNKKEFSKIIINLINGTGEAGEVGYTAQIYKLIEKNMNETSLIIENIFEDFIYKSFQEVNSMFNISNKEYISNYEANCQEYNSKELSDDYDLLGDSAQYAELLNI